MADSLLTWPLRTSLRGVETALRATRDLADLGLVAVELAGRVLGDREPRGAPTAPTSPSVAEPRPPRPAPLSEVDRDRSNGVAPPPAAPVAEAVDLDALRGIDTSHVDDEPELVAEFSEPGAQDGAGASIHFAAPFDGYETLRAADIVARLPGSDAAMLGAIELYEASHRRRRSVLDAVNREARRRG
jgi:hypothetical protein